MHPTFMLGAIPVTLEQDIELVKREGLIGKAIYQTQRILYDDSATPGETVEQAVTHELVHWILHVMHEHDLKNNERFVDVFAAFLHQAMQTGFINFMVGERELP